MRLLKLFLNLIPTYNFYMEQPPSAASLLPDWHLAELHAQAVSTGRPIHEMGDQPVCKCCNNVIEREPVNVCANKKSLAYLGFGVPLFYLFIKYCIVLNLLLIVTDGVVSVYRAYETNTLSCQNYYQAQHKNPGTNFIHLRTKTLNPKNQVLVADQMSILCSTFWIKIASVEKGAATPEVLLRISSFFIHLLFLIYIKIALYQTGEYYNEISVDLADYSTIFKCLPRGAIRKRQTFHTIISNLKNDKNQPLGYYDILVVPRKEELQKLLTQKQHQKSHYLHLREEHPQQAQQVYNEYCQTLRKIQFQVMECKQQLLEDRVPSENVIVSFNTQTDRKLFMEDRTINVVRQKLEHYYRDDASKVVIEQAPGPKQIIWHNLKHSAAKPLRILLGWGLSLGFLALTLVVFYFINMFKANLIVGTEFDLVKNPNSAVGQTNTTLVRIIAWSTFIGIILYNKFVMGKVLHHFTDLQHHDFKSDYAFSFGFKYALGMFFTTCLMTVTVEALVHHNYYSHPFGVIEQESLMFIFSAILVPLIWMMNPYQLMHLNKRKKKRNSTKVTQKEANKLMADEEYSIGKRYAQIIEMMWFTYLYTDLIPGGMFVIIFGLMAYYWVDKYNLLRRSSVTYNISADLSFKVSDLIDWTLFWRFFGQIIFDYQLQGKAHTYSFVLLGLSLVYVFLPTRAIVKKFSSEEFNPNDKPLRQAWNSYFKYDNYRSMNPIFSTILGDGESEKYFLNGTQKDKFNRKI